MAEQAEPAEPVAGSPTPAATRRLPGLRQATDAWWGQLALFAVLAVALFFLVPSPTLAVEVLIYGLWAMSCNLLLGYGGLVSFGHALYWGYGGYVSGLILVHHISGSLWVSLAAAAVISGLIALAAGAVCLRRREVYFSMLTLAFAQLAYFIAFEARPVTGGDDGLSNIPTPPITLPGVTIALHPLRDTAPFFFLAVILVGACLALLLLYTHSPLGRALQAIRESEERARGCGYNTRLVQLITFTVAGVFAGLAGGLDSVFNGFLGLEPYWLLSGLVVIMVILGGRGSLFGSLLGAAAFLLLQHYLQNAFAQWQLILGAIFIAVILVFPQGLWGMLRLEGGGDSLRRLIGRAP